MGPCSQQGGHGAFGTMTGHLPALNRPKGQLAGASLVIGVSTAVGVSGKWQATQ